MSRSMKAKKQAELQTKIKTYQQFIENTLKRDLQICSGLQEKVQQRYNNYASLRQSIQSLQTQHAAEKAAGAATVKRMKTMVNMGSEFYMKAVVPDPTRLFMDVGLGFHVELTLAEAETFIVQSMLPSLEKDLARYKKQSSEIQAKIKMVLEGISELMQLEQMEKEQGQKSFF